MMSIARRFLVIAGELRVIHIEQVVRQGETGIARGRSVPG
jgi:hypothetical protein